MKESYLGDDALLKSIIKGEEEGFNGLFRKYYKVLCAKAFLYVGDHDQAQSLVQDCFVKLWDKRSDLKRVSNLPAFLTTMVRNKSIDFVRSLKSQQNTIDGFEQTVNSVEENLAPVFEFEEQVGKALNNLPERCREAFEFSRFEGLSYKEIGERMEISTKGVEALIGRSLRILRTQLSDYLFLGILLFF